MFDVGADSNVWRQAARCRGMNPDLFFPERGQDQDYVAALAVCAECPVTQQCLEANLHERAGVWGGTTGRQRAAIRRERAGGRLKPQGRVATVKCGDFGVGGVKAHWRRGEKPCEACRQARTAYEAWRREQKTEQQLVRDAERARQKAEQQAEKKAAQETAFRERASRNWDLLQAPKHGGHTA